MPHANFLHRAGYAVLMFDYRHRGESDGNAITMAVREQDDLLGAIDYACSRPEVDAGRIAVEGLSMGSGVAILVAARDQRVRAVVAECPYATYQGMMSKALRHYGRLPSYPLADLARLVLEWRIGGSLEGAQPSHAVAAISPRPVFIIADEHDEVIGCDETERVFHAAAEPKRFWLIAGSDHSRGWQAAPEEYERRVLGFLAESLAAANAGDARTSVA
jgi:pimeloyl-ACP methyl ester carboxylesterase